MSAKKSARAKGSPYRVQVLDRALGVLEVLWKEGPEMTLAEITKRLRLNKSTARRLVLVLEQHRFIEKSPQNGKYRLGLKLFEMGSSAVAHLDIRERARPYLERLVFETGETAHLCILDEGEVLYLEKMEPSRTVRMPSSVGRRNPAHCTAVGKALLAFLSESDLDNLIKRHGLRAYTRNTITTLAQLKRELQLVRDRGYALDNEEIEEGLECIGAPVRDYSGKVVASISIAGPAFRMTEDQIPVLARSVVKTANDLSAELGYQEPQLKKNKARMELGVGA
jgi:DNA-binding IclR family transcriptional regulator